MSTHGYISANELDERPTPIRFFEFSQLPLPPQASGKLIVQLWINESGAIDMVQIEESDVPEAMENLIREQWRGLQFSAGKKGGVGVKSLVRYELTLSPEVLQPVKSKKWVLPP